MNNPFDAWCDLKCTKCIHSELCMQRLGGTDLTIAVTDCEHFKEAVVLPEKCWLIFDVPGFYDINEYQIERVTYYKGALEKIWATDGHSTIIANADDNLLFFDFEEAKMALAKLIEDRRSS